MTIKIIIDDFRISDIFDIEEPVPERELANALQERSFKVTHDRVITHPPIRAIILNIATKNNVNVIYQKESIPSYIGVAGRDKKEVIKQFELLNSILTNIDPTIQGRYIDIEMVISAKVFGNDLPYNTIGSLCSIDASRFDNLFQTPMKPFYITFESKESLPYYSLTLAPLARSPRYYYVQLVNRNKELAKVVEFSEQTEDIINGAIALLEQK